MLFRLSCSSCRVALWQELHFSSSVYQAFCPFSSPYPAALPASRFTTIAAPPLVAKTSME